MNLYINRDPAPKLRINLHEARLVRDAVLAANPTTEAELDAALATIRAYGPLVNRCLADETAALRPELLALLIGPRLRLRLTFQTA